MIDILTELATNFGGATFRSLLRYGVVCGGAIGLFWVLLAKPLEHRRIQDKEMSRADVLSELKHSIFATLVGAVVAALVLWFHDQGWLKVYMDPMEHGVPWLVGSTLLLVFGFDAYFYWGHRLMHHASLYSWVHERHDESTDPSPLAAYSFTAFEMLVYAVFGPILMFLLPLNFFVLMVSGIFFAFASAYVHLGYELAPRWWNKSIFTRWIGTATMHNMHHEHTHYTYGLYFCFWHRWMGTMHPDHDETIDELADQPLFLSPAKRASA